MANPLAGTVVKFDNGYHAFKLAEDYCFQTRHKLQALDDYETKFTAWWKVNSDVRFAELVLNDIDQSYFDKIWIHETRGKTLDQALALVAAVKKVDATYVTGAAGSETVVALNVRKAIKTTFKAPAIFIA